MWDVLFAFGRGVIKLLIALFIGVGAGLVTIGSQANRSPEIWNFREPPPFGPLLLGIGVGLLTAGGVLFVLMFIGRPRRRVAYPAARPMTVDESTHRDQATPAAFARPESFRSDAAARD